MTTDPLLSVINASLPKTVQTGQEGYTPKGNESVFSQFAEGQLLRATVLSVQPDNQYFLETNGTRILVKSQTQLEPGRPLDLQVVRSGTGVELQIIPDPLSRFFSRSFTAIANNLDLTSFVNQFLQAGKEQPANLSNRTAQVLQEFSLLQQQSIPTTGAPKDLTGTAQPGSLPQTDLASSVVSQLFSQFEKQLNKPGSADSGQLVLSTFKKTVQDISLLFREKNQLPPALQKQLDNLSPAKKQIFDILMQIQSTLNEKVADNSPVQRLFQIFQLQPEAFLNTASLPSSLNTLKTGFSDLFFLLKGPESVLQLFATRSLTGELLTQVQAGSLSSLSSEQAGTQYIAGEQLKQLIASLGLDFESRLAQGDRDGALKTVKAGLIELLQNFMGQSKLSESTARAVSTIEFFQLLQLQLNHQGTLVLPLPLPFLDQGYLVIEDYREQLAGKGGEQNTLNRFSLYLKLTPLGNLKVDFLYSGEGVYIRFTSASQQTSDFLKDFKTELSEAVSDTVIHSVSFSQESEDPLTAILKKDSTGESSFLNSTV